MTGKIEIILDAGGHMHVNAPVDNRQLCYTMFSHAMRAIASHNSGGFALAVQEPKEEGGFITLKIPVNRPREAVQQLADALLYVANKTARLPINLPAGGKLLGS